MQGAQPESSVQSVWMAGGGVVAGSVELLCSCAVAHCSAKGQEPVCGSRSTPQSSSVERSIGDQRSAGWLHISRSSGHENRPEVKLWLARDSMSWHSWSSAPSPSMPCLYGATSSSR